MNYKTQRNLSLSIITIMTALSVTYVLLTSILVHGLLKDITYLESERCETKVINLEPKSVEKTTILNPKSVYLPIDNVPSNKKISKKKNKTISKDTYLLAQIINAEAGTQSYEGKLAVGTVVMNRVESDNFPNTIRKVIYQKGQFSPVRNGSINKKPSKESIRAAKEVMSGNRSFDKNVLFFYNPDISTSKWIFTRKVIAKIGDHAFAV